MKVELIGMTVAVDDDLMFGDASDLCGLAAATCTGSDNRERSLKGAMSCGHESVIEHAQYTFKVEGVSRRLLAQITRHRIASFSVKSQRYCVGVPAVVEPPTIGWHPQVLDAWEELTKASRRFYEMAVTLGVPAEDAAFGLLEGSETEFVFSMNARELRHFLALRTCNRAQWEIRGLADMILAIMKKIEPKMFKDAGCGCMNKGCTEGKMACGHPRAKG